MNISPNEAEEALASIDRMTQRTRSAIGSSGISTSLIVTGVVWLLGYTATQFLTPNLAVIVWVVSGMLGALVATVLGIRAGKRVRSPSAAETTRRAGIFWLLLLLFGIAIILLTQPADGKQMTVLIILLVMIGQLAMGLLLGFQAVWWVLPISALTLAGYYLMSDYFYLWMAILGGGGLIALGVYIRTRW